MIGKYLNHSLLKIGKVGIKSIAEVKNLGGNIVSLFPEGGTVLELNGYRIHTFTKDGILDIPRAITVEYLIVAAGGRGGDGYYFPNSANECYSGSGGGAGGVRQGTTGLLEGTSIAITVGQTSGANSSMGTISATGGGNGSFLKDGGAGGSGAGGSSHHYTQCYGGAGNKGGYSPAEGYKGGKGTVGGSRVSGGGGGAGGAGTDSSNTVPGVGGVGITSSISGTSKTYATGGSGNSRTNGNGANGSPNTGNGGQGGGGINGGVTGGEGGSGIVIIRYPL